MADFYVRCFEVLPGFFWLMRPIPSTLGPRWEYVGHEVRRG